MKKSLFTHLKSIFLSGFFAIFPLAATILVMNFLYHLSIQWLTPLKSFLPSLVHTFPGAELIFMILILLCIGLLARLFIIIPFLHYLEKIIEKIPLLSSIYSSAKSVVDFFAVSHENAAYRKVVLIRYPHQSYQAIAFLLGPANTYEDHLPASRKNEPYYRVFMPTSPSPGTGYFFILPQSEIEHTSLTFEDAIKAIVSCGLLNPKNRPTSSEEQP